MAHKLTWEDHRLMEAGVYKCRICDATKPLSERMPRYAACRECVRVRSNLLRKVAYADQTHERHARKALAMLAKLRFEGDCMVCGSPEHTADCNVARLTADLKQLGWVKEASA